MHEITQKQLDALMRAKESVDKQYEIAKPMIDAGMNPITAMIMAGDQMSMQRADEFVAAGESIQAASVHVGSYSRFDWVVKQYHAGKIDLETLSEWICLLWRGADPDDTREDFIDLWNEVHAYRNGNIIYDEEEPKELPEEVTLYRGQLSPNDPIGLSWSTNKEIATKFAKGAAIRVLTDGFLGTTKVHRKDIIAYITGRNEFEAIVDPNNVGTISWEYVERGTKK